MLVQIFNSSIIVTKVSKNQLRTNETHLDSFIGINDDYIIRFVDIEDIPFNFTNKNSFYFLIFDKTHEISKSSLSLISCGIYDLKCKILEGINLGVDVTAIGTFYNGIYLTSHEKSVVYLLDNFTHFDPERNLTYPSNMLTPIKFRGKWLGCNENGIFELKTVNNTILGEDKNITEGNFSILHSTENYLIGYNIYEENKSHAVVLYLTENNDGKPVWKNYTLNGFEENLKDFYEWDTFLVFYGLDNMVIFRPSEIDARVSKMNVLKSQYLMLNQSSVPDNNFLISLVPNGKKVTDGVTFYEYKKVDEEFRSETSRILGSIKDSTEYSGYKFYTRETVLNRLSITCSADTYQELINNPVELVVFYGLNPDSRKVETYYVTFVDRGANPNPILIILLLLVGFILIAVIVLVVLNIILLIKKNKGKAYEKRIRNEYSNAI